MNLVATEYITCQENCHGILILSQLIGVAIFIGAGSITFDSSNIQQLSDSIYIAVIMSPKEKEKRYLQLGEFITTNTRYIFLFL